MRTPVLALLLALACNNTEAVDDPDADTDVNVCEAFCTEITRACPSDSACLESCTTTCPADFDGASPSAEDQTCAEAATDCASAGPCWGFCM